MSVAVYHLDRYGDVVGGLSGHTDVWRNLCYNLIIIAHEKVGRRSVRHVGDIKEQVREVIEQTINQTTTLLTGFASDWNIALNTPIRKVFGTDDIRAVMNEIARSRAFDPLGISRDSAVEILVGGWEDERETNLAAIVNAVTAAHKRVAVEKVPEWEAAGGKVLKALVMQAQA